MPNKTDKDIRYYDSPEYAKRKEEADAKAAEIREEKEKRAKKKEELVKKEVLKLKKIFTKDRCGEENMHIVCSLVERAAWLRVELEFVEKDLQTEGMMDFFQQGVQHIWREHPLSKVHVQHSKSYRDTIKLLEGYGKSEGSKPDDSNPLTSPTGILARGDVARSKYR